MVYGLLIFLTSPYMKDQGQKWMFGAAGLLVGVLLTVGYYTYAGSGLGGQSVQGRLGSIIESTQQGGPISTKPLPLKVPSDSECWSMYQVLVNSGSGGLSTWLKKNVYPDTDLKYCFNFITSSQWYFDGSKLKCSDMYTAWKSSRSMLGFSAWLANAWLPNKGIAHQAVLYCVYKMGANN